jgi:hypothetical protein
MNFSSGIVKKHGFDGTANRSGRAAKRILKAEG